jgi:hypothetical protein
MSDSPHPLPQGSEKVPDADGYMAGLRLSAKLIAAFAAVLAILLIADPILLLAYAGYVALAFSPVVALAAVSRVASLRKSGQGAAVAGLLTVTVTTWVLAIALCGWEQYDFMTTTFTLRLP